MKRKRKNSMSNVNLPGDINNDNKVNAADLSVLNANFGKKVEPGTSGDINNDGSVNNADLSILLSNWGKTYTPPAAPAPITPKLAHSSQKIINGPAFFCEISQGRFVDNSNPRGWAWPHSLSIETEGWWALMETVEQAAETGYKSILLWEPTGQWVGIGDCMAWFSKKTANDGFNATMRKSFKPFIRSVKRLGMKVGVYSGCASSPNIGSTLFPNRIDPPYADAQITHWVEAAKYCVESGIDILGLDAFSWLMHIDPVFTEKVVRAVRTACPNLCLITEGWVASEAKSPAVLSVSTRQYLISQLVNLDLVRAGTDPTKDENWLRIKEQEELTLVPDRRGLMLLHGWPWTKEQELAVYTKINSYKNIYPCDWRIPLNWKPISSI